MKYEEFRENIICSGYTFKSLAELLNMNPASICNYSSKNNVPETMAVLSILLKEARLSSPSILKKLDQHKSTLAKMDICSSKEAVVSTNEELVDTVKPILKWAGGKSQLIPFLLKHTPTEYGTYIEPFIGGGAFFFHLCPKKAIIADSNIELINLYKVIAHKPKQLIRVLQHFKNEKDFYYKTRELDFEQLEPIDAAARTIFLNKTCFNGLYRVNKQGKFNTPYGAYKRTKFIDEANLLAAASLLKRTTILQGDFQEIVEEFAKPNDFIFLDPPYLPVSEYSDFNRYTKDTFSFDDQKRVANLATKKAKEGVHVLLTNSTNPMVFDLYKDFDHEIIQTKRNISKIGEKRKGEDAIFFSKKDLCTFHSNKEVSALPWNDQIKLFPSSRYMGSKSKLISNIAEIFQELNFNSALDLFSGSSSVGYLLKSLGKEVISNDYMHMNFFLAKTLIENSGTLLSEEKILSLVSNSSTTDNFVAKNFSGLYFSDEDNKQIDILRCNINNLNDQFEIALAKSALIRAALKKRARGIFTFTGFKYDDGRLDLRKSIFDHFKESVEIFNNAVFNNGFQNQAICSDAISLDKDADLIYMDPPYCSKYSDNEYVRRYHFLEGLARDWKGVEIQDNTKTKKFKSYPTPFSNKRSVFAAFENLFSKYKDKIIVLSYSSNSIPSKDEIKIMLEKQNKQVRIFEINHKYSCGNQNHKIGDNKNDVQEYVFIAS